MATNPRLRFVRRHAQRALYRLQSEAVSLRARLAYHAAYGATCVAQRFSKFALESNTSPDDEIRVPCECCGATTNRASLDENENRWRALCWSCDWREGPFLADSFIDMMNEHDRVELLTKGGAS